MGILCLVPLWDEFGSQCCEACFGCCKIARAIGATTPLNSASDSGLPLVAFLTLPPDLLSSPRANGIRREWSVSMWMPFSSDGREESA